MKVSVSLFLEYGVVACTCQTFMSRQRLFALNLYYDASTPKHCITSDNGLLATPAALMRSMQPMTSVPMKARMQTFTVSGLSKELARLLAQYPVPSKASMVVIHRSHGAATYPHSTRSDDPMTSISCMPNREPHTILCITGSAVPGGEDGVSETP